MSALTIDRKTPRRSSVCARLIPVGGIFYDGDRTYMRLCRGAVAEVFSPTRPFGPDCAPAVDLHTGSVVVFSDSFVVGVVENAVLSYEVKP